VVRDIGSGASTGKTERGTHSLWGNPVSQRRGAQNLHSLVPRPQLVTEGKKLKFPCLSSQEPPGCTFGGQQLNKGVQITHVEGMKKGEKHVGVGYL